jgi:hypothetical protein
MPERQMNPEKAEDKDALRRRKNAQKTNNPVKATGRNTTRTDYRAHSSSDEHVSLLARAASDGQRAEIAGQLQQSYGNSYVEEVVQGLRHERGSGKALEPEVRSEMEAAFGQDFSGVRVHTGAGPGRLSEGLKANAFTTGQDIFFNEGAYQPDTEKGKKLLAHEIAHAAQQPGEAGIPDRISRSGDTFEREADAAVSSLESGASIKISTQPGLAGAIARQGDRELEERVGPLERPVAGPPQTVVSDATRTALEGRLGECFNKWHDGASNAVTDFVSGHDHEASYGPLVFAIIGAPLAIVGAALSGPAVITLAIASTAVSVLSAVPAAPDPIRAFSERMRDTFARVYANRQNSTRAIVSNYLLDVSPDIAADQTRLEQGLVASCFPGNLHLGVAVNDTEVRARVTAELAAKWAAVEAERQRREDEENRRIRRMLAYPMRYR